MFEEIHPELIWFLIGLFFILAEFIVPGFIIIFFGAGAWITALLTGFGIVESFNAQLLTFLISSILSLLLFRKQGKRYFEGKRSGTELSDDKLEDVKGRRALVVKAIVPPRAGEVEFNGSAWKAEAEVPVAEGTSVEIIERRNLILIVKPLS